MNARRLAVLLFVMSAACVWPPAPKPTPAPTPTPVAHEPVCVPPGLVTGCWHQPPGEDWQFIPAPTPPTPPPTGCQAVDLTANEVQGPAQLQRHVIRAIAELGDMRGHPISEILEALAAKLRSYGLCAFAGSEAVFVKRSDGLHEEYHAVYSADGSWTDSGRGKYIGLHRSTGAPPATPPPTASTCPVQPCPIRTWTRETLPSGWGDNEIGQPAWQWKAKVHTMGNADSTPVTRRQEPYCRAIGLSPYADGQPRAECPMRPDGHPDREAVEYWLLQGPPVRERCTGWVGSECRGVALDGCEPNNTTNAFAFLAGTGACRICNTPRTTCSAWF